MYFDPNVLATYLVDRRTGGGKQLRRVAAIHADGTLSLSKPNGVVRRIIQLANVTHIISAPNIEEDLSDDDDDNGDDTRQYLAALSEAEQQVMTEKQKRRFRAARRAAADASSSFDRSTSPLTRSQYGVSAAEDPRAWVLLRIANEHDVLMLHVPVWAAAAATARGGNNNMSGGDGDALFDAGAFAALATIGGQDRAIRMARTPQGVHFLDLMQRERSKLRAAPLRMATKTTCTALIDAADVVRRPTFAKPKSFAIVNHILTPMTFDDFPISVPASPNDANHLGSSIGEASLCVEQSFLTHLHRAARAHPSASSQPPLVRLDAPAPYPAIEISAKFLAAFCIGFDEHMPHTVVVQSHLPVLTTFRASRRFWRYLQAALRVSRPPQTAVSMLRNNHVVIHLDGDSSMPALSATANEYNDVIVAWEADVRSRVDVAGGSIGLIRGSSAAETAEGCFWASFVDEIATLASSNAAFDATTVTSNHSGP